MIYRSTLIGLIIATSIGMSLFYVKYQVLGLEGELSNIHQEIFKTEEALHLLRAEWAYLNDPARLKVLASKHLKMDAATPLQMISLQTSGSNMNLPGGTGLAEPIVVRWQNQP